jgi:arsenate reductase
MNRPILYGIKNCDTVKRARAWLDEHAVAYDFHDYKTQGVPAANLKRWLDDKGMDVMINRRGPTWRKLDDATRASVVDTPSAMAVMSANSSIIKRPVVEWGAGRLTVGFDEAAFEAAVGTPR